MISKKTKIYFYRWSNESSTTGFAFYQYCTFSVTNNTEEQLNFLLCKTHCKQHFMAIYTCLKQIWIGPSDFDICFCMIFSY